MNIRISYQIDSEKIPYEVEQQIDDASRQLTAVLAQISEARKLISGKDADHIVAMGRLGSIRTVLAKADLTLDNAMNILEGYMSIFNVAPVPENPLPEADDKVS